MEESATHTKMHVAETVRLLEEDAPLARLYQSEMPNAESGGENAALRGLRGEFVALAGAHLIAPTLKHYAQEGSCCTLPVLSHNLLHFQTLSSQLEFH